MDDSNLINLIRDSIKEQAENLRHNQELNKKEICQMQMLNEKRLESLEGKLDFIADKLVETRIKLAKVIAIGAISGLIGGYTSNNILDKKPVFYKNEKIKVQKVKKQKGE